MNINIRLFATAICMALPLFGVPRSAAAGEAKSGALDERLELKDQTTGSWVIVPMRPSYVLPLSYNSSPNQELAEEVTGNPDAELDNVEVKFQISFMLTILDEALPGKGDVNFAYTQVSIWQAYNFDASSPFYDNNYEPEVFLSFDTDYDVLGLRNRLITLGLVHQSNGRGDSDLSRSWNRAYANFVLERGNFACSLKPWLRLGETDENSDIDRFMGYGELKLAYTWREYGFAALGRDNLRIPDNKGALQLDFTFPLVRNIKGYVQFFTGYGETLMDYDQCHQRIGVGVLLADWL